ncbi:MAG: helix-turn-helix transcriptional regulator [Bacteroidota bacterium]
MRLETVTIKDVKLAIAELTRTMRKQQSLSRSDLAEQLNLSRITIQNLETGQNVTIDTLLKVLQHFDLLNKFDDLLKNEMTDHSYKSLY